MSKIAPSIAAVVRDLAILKPTFEPPVVAMVERQIGKCSGKIASAFLLGKPRPYVLVGLDFRVRTGDLVVGCLHAAPSGAGHTEEIPI
jgi:hypothetical protein